MYARVHEPFPEVAAVDAGEVKQAADDVEVEVRSVAVAPVPYPADELTLIVGANEWRELHVQVARRVEDAVERELKLAGIPECLVVLVDGNEKPPPWRGPYLVPFRLVNSRTDFSELPSSKSAY